MPVNIFLVLAMGLAVGFISGLFGIGGGFIPGSSEQWASASLTAIQYDLSKFPKMKAWLYASIERPAARTDAAHIELPFNQRSVAFHAMADRIGVLRKWHQGDHYDITKSKRALAVAAKARFAMES